MSVKSPIEISPFCI